MRRLLVLLALALAGCSSKPAAEAPHPALWEVRDADTTIYLFGSVHVLKPDLPWFQGRVKQAFDGSDTLVLELLLPPDAEMQALVRELGTTAGAPTLSSQLPPAEADKLHAALGQYGMPPSALEGVEPWLAATTLSVLPLEKLGYAQESGTEAVLTRAARAEHKKMVGLETAREQLGYLDRLSHPAQIALLTETIDDLPKTGATTEAMIRAWSAGDADRLAALLNDDTKDSPELTQALLVRRNRHWADWIKARMAQPGTVFLAVGAGHLAGADGLQGELTKRGLKVERVQ